MTTTNKDITNFLEEQGISYNPIRMLNLLGKLDHEDLGDLLNAMQDSYWAGEDSRSKYSKSQFNEGYDKGYADGYSDGFATEE